MKVSFLDLSAQNERLRSSIDEAFAAVVGGSQFIGGEVVRTFENDVCTYAGVRHAIGVSSCTAALSAVLRTLLIEPDDEVIVPTLTAIPTPEAVSLAGGRVVFADVDEKTLQLDPRDVESRITDCTRAIVPVHLHGASVDLTALLGLARRRGLALVEDTAQAFGATYLGRPLGTSGLAGCLSFFPSKPLGGFGDGGMVLTDDDELARSVRRYCNHGRLEKFTHEVVGSNERLDGLQAAILSVKLRVLDDWNERRRNVAAWYREELEGLDEVRLPAVVASCEPVWHVYAIRHPRRDELRAALSADGIGTGLHYPLPCHLQPVYEHLGLRPGSLPVAEEACATLLSLPMDPFLTRDEVAHVGRSVRSFCSPSLVAGLSSSEPLSVQP